MNGLPSTSCSSQSKKNSKSIPQFTKLSMKDFRRIKDLGSGSYGIVQLVNLHG